MAARKSIAVRLALAMFGIAGAKAQSACFHAMPPAGYKSPSHPFSSEILMAVWTVSRKVGNPVRRGECIRCKRGRLPAIWGAFCFMSQ